MNFKLNQWVIKKCGTVHTLAYVTNVSNVPSAGGIRYHLKVVGYNNGSYVEMRKPIEDTCSPVPLEKMPENFFDKFQDFSALIDIALATGDEAYFNELMKRKQKARELENA